MLLLLLVQLFHLVRKKQSKKTATWLSVRVERCVPVVQVALVSAIPNLSYARGLILHIRHHVVVEAVHDPERAANDNDKHDSSKDKRDEAPAGVGFCIDM